MKGVAKAWAPLAAALFLAPLIGGQIYVSAMKVEPGSSALNLILKGAPETPWLSHAYLGLFVLAAAVWIGATQKVVAIPRLSIAALMVFFGGCLVASVSGSSFKMVTLATVSEWLIYLAAFFVGAAAAGRGGQARVLLGSAVAGCALVSLMGVLEYGQMRSIDPTWRIFASWVNSNALAGVLLLGLMLGLGLCLTSKGLPALASGLASSAVALALLLTQSRGALLYALPVGLGVLLIGALAAKGSGGEKGLRLAKVLAPLALGAVLLGAMSAAKPQSAFGAPVPAALSRVVTEADRAREQSGSFRLMLWKSSLQLIRQNPSGYGLGTFRFEGSRSGLIVPTQLAHQTFLQLGAEASLAAPAALLVAGLLWLVAMLKGFQKTPFELSATRLSIVAAAAASVVHNLFDSDLYYFGIGLTFFALLGIGLSVAADGVSPEYFPAPIRIFPPVLVAAAVAALALMGSSKLLLSEGLGALEAGDLPTARQLFDRAAESGLDGEAFYLRARAEPPGPERLSFLKKAVQAEPSPKFYRALAREQAMAGQTYEAVDSLTLALKRDPNNLQTLSQLLELQKSQGQLAEAVSTAERIVRVEESPSFRIRAISEAVPVQTFEARLFLASQETSARRAVDWLRPAVEGFREYVKTTVPRVIQHAEAAEGLPFAGETVESALQALESAREAAMRLRAAYRRLGDRTGIAEAESALAEFAAASDSLRRISK